MNSNAIEQSSITPFLNKITVGDATSIMRSLPSGSIDVIVTSPPYNLKNSTGNGMKDGRGGKWANARLIDGYDDYSDCLPHHIYVEWQRECLHEMMRLLNNTLET